MFAELCHIRPTPILLSQLARGLSFSKEGGVVSILEDFGNTSSASMGMAIDKLRRSGDLQESDLILLPAFGAGFTWGAGLCRANGKPIRSKGQATT
jgi:3-oxoacyl-[acyl-carrier-protein] synthase-3